MISLQFFCIKIMLFAKFDFFQMKGLIVYKLNNTATCNKSKIVCDFSQNITFLAKIRQSLPTFAKRPLFLS